jgi:hypothetical protein
LSETVLLFNTSNPPAHTTSRDLPIHTVTKSRARSSANQIH